MLSALSLCCIFSLVESRYSGINWSFFTAIFCAIILVTFSYTSVDYCCILSCRSLSSFVIICTVISSAILRHQLNSPHFATSFPACVFVFWQWLNFLSSLANSRVLLYPLPHSLLWILSVDIYFILPAFLLSHQSYRVNFILHS